MILGVTGGIASGKSLVTELFGRLGAPVVSADDLAREVVSPGSPLLRQLVERFGPGIIDGTGTLNRKELAAIVFTDGEARLDLNGIMHPAIAALAEERLEKLSGAAPLVVYEAPLLFEAGAERRVDAIVVVRIGSERQLERLMARNGLTEAEAKSRIAAQMPEAEKVARADFVIDNSGPVEETEAQVRQLFLRLTRGHSSPGGQ